MPWRETELKTVCLWSGPRNVSTVLTYSFAGVDGIKVVDEALYGRYLAVTGAQGCCGRADDTAPVEAVRGADGAGRSRGRLDRH